MTTLATSRPAAVGISARSAAQAEPSAPAPPEPPADELTTIVFLSANPSDTAKLNLDRELARISTKLSDSANYGNFRLRSKKAVTPSEFREYLFLEKPDIVHFSGHGDKSSPEVSEALSRAGRSSMPQAQQAEESGIFLSDEDKRNAQFVGSAFLKHAFRSLVGTHRVALKAVVFNACHSSEQAKAVSEAAVPSTTRPTNAFPHSACKFSHSNALAGSSAATPTAAPIWKSAS